MKIPRTKKNIWIVVKVWRGFPAEVKAFRNKESALKQETLWRKHLNPDYDEIGVFQIDPRRISG